MEDGVRSGSEEAQGLQMKGVLDNVVALETQRLQGQGGAGGGAMWSSG